MQRFTYRLTPIGWVGAAMLVLPTPIAMAVLAPRRLSAGDRVYQDALNKVMGPEGVASKLLDNINNTLAVCGVAATATLVGIVLLLIGREIISGDQA